MAHILQESEGVSGSLIYQGEIFDSENTKSFLDNRIVNGTKFLLLKGGSFGKRIEGIKWQRYKNLIYNHQIPMRFREGEYDSLIFTPRKDVLFLGFGMMANYA